MLRWLIARWRGGEAFRFLVIGGWNTAFGYLSFLVFYLFLQGHLHYLLIAVLAYFVATINAYACHRWLTFRSRGSVLGEFLRFTLTQAVALGFNLAGLWLLVEIAHLNLLASQAVVMVVTVVLTYVAHRRITFVT